MIENEVDELLHIQIEGEGYKLAKDLTIEDKLISKDGEEVIITDIKYEKLDKFVKVYNITLNNYHTYFVGDTLVLVHNSDACKKGLGSKWNNTKKINIGDNT